MRASRRLMPTAEDLLKKLEYWVQGHGLGGALEGPLGRHIEEEELCNSRKRMILLLETEPQSRGHATANAHCTMDHGTKALCSPSGVSYLPMAICTFGR